MSEHADDLLREAAATLDPDRPIAEAADDVLRKLDRLQVELDRLLAGLQSTADTLSRRPLPDAGGDGPA